MKTEEWINPLWAARLPMLHIHCRIEGKEKYDPLEKAGPDEDGHMITASLTNNLAAGEDVDVFVMPDVAPAEVAQILRKTRRQSVGSTSW